MTAGNNDRRIAVNTDEVRDIDAEYPSRGWNAIEIEPRLDSVGMMIASSLHRSEPTPMSEPRRFSLIFARVGVPIRQLHCRSSCISRALPAIVLALHFRTER